MYLVQLVKIQNLSFHVRDFQSASLKLPEFCNLIQEVELNSGLSLKAGKEKLMLCIKTFDYLFINYSYHKVGKSQMTRDLCPGVVNCHKTIFS